MIFYRLKYEIKNNNTQNETTCCKYFRVFSDLELI